MKYFLDHDARGLFDRTGTNATLNIVRMRYMNWSVTMLRGLKLVDEGDTGDLVKVSGLNWRLGQEKQSRYQLIAGTSFQSRKSKIVHTSQIIIIIIND